MPFKSGASIKSVAPVLHSGKMFHISLCQREHQLLYIKICQGAEFGVLKTIPWDKVDIEVRIFFQIV